MPPTTQSRERIIEAAMELFAFQGYGPTGLSQIAEKAGVQSGSIYHFFPTKEHVLAATLERRKALLWPELLSPVWDKVDDPIERVFALLDQYRRMLHITEFSHGCPIGNLAIELTESHPNSRRLIAENFDGWLRAIAECFRAASGRLPTGIEPEKLAIFVLTTMEGAVMLARTYRDFRAYDAAVGTLRDYIDRLVASETDWSAPPSSNHPEARRKRPLK
ncbi:MAG: TetR/AcrR family transcriptional regulator [Phycisphaerales bacterium]